MAVERIPSDQYNAIVNDARFRPIDEHGKKRIVFFNVPAVTVAGDALSTFDLARLPPGAVRVLLAECKIQTSAWGAARLLDIGYAYEQATRARRPPTFPASIDESAPAQ